MRHISQRLLLGLVLAAGYLVVSAPTASAGECDLYTASSSCVYGATGAIFNVVAPQPTGSGVIDSFLRIQQNGTEQGFNTNARPMYCDGAVCDDKTDLTFTHNLLTSAVPVVTINGVQYREFFLDINEPTSGQYQYLTLDQVEIFQSDTASLSSHVSTGGGKLNGLTSIWDLDQVSQTSPAPGQPNNDNWINLSYALVGGGSGSGDMVMYIPNALFSSKQYVYLYSQFGCSGTACGTTNKYSSTITQFASQAGFEEWWVKGGGGSNGLTPVPEPGSMALLATGLALVVRKRRSTSKSRS